MSMDFQELRMYKNFDELASDLLELAKEILPEQMIYLTSISETQQIILKMSNEKSSIQLAEGMVFNLEKTVCNRINFEKNQPLIYENIDGESDLNDLKKLLKSVNVQSYLGIPISMVNGEKFGTLCAVNDKESQFDNKSINLLQRIVRMFSYYLELERFAFKDSLTELYNRRYLYNFLEDHSKAEGVIFFLDLDGFKKVNDTHGHDVGDLILKEVASRIQKFAEEYHGDAFSVRLGGDEFVIHFTGPSNKEELLERTERILGCLSTWDDKYQLSASIGITKYSVNDNININKLLKHADLALYNAKKAGKNTYKFFEA